MIYIIQFAMNERGAKQEYAKKILNLDIVGHKRNGAGCLS